MPITTDWYNDEKKIIVTTYNGEYAWDEVYKHVAQGNMLAESVDHPVGLLIDVSNAGSLPANAGSHGKRVRDMYHDNIACLVVVGANLLLQAVTNISKQVFQILGNRPIPIFVSTIDEAVDYINNHLPSQAQNGG